MNKTIHFMHKTMQTVNVYYTLNGNITVAMTLPRFRCLVEFQGVMEQIYHTVRGI